MASADFSRQILFQPSFHSSVRPPRVRIITFFSCNCYIYCMGFGQYWTLSWVADSSSQFSLIYSFCSSVQEFAYGFLQIPPREGHPCLLLTVPTAKPVVDFHHLAITHAGHTTKKLPHARLGLWKFFNL